MKTHQQTLVEQIVRVQIDGNESCFEQENLLMAFGLEGLPQPMLPGSPVFCKPPTNNLALWWSILQ
jgi:hypothetical protein